MGGSTTFVWMRTGMSREVEFTSGRRDSNLFYATIRKHAWKRKFQRLRLGGLRINVDAAYSGRIAVVRLSAKLGPARRSVLTIALASDPIKAPCLWQAMHETTSAVLATDAEQPPVVPWVAERLEEVGGEFIDAVLQHVSEAIADCWFNRP